MTDAVFVDTSVWIDFFRGRNQAVLASVRALIRSEQAVLVGVVLAEVLQGVRSAADRQRVEGLEALTYIEMTRPVWERAGDLSKLLRQQGQEVPLTDVVVAALALEHDLSIFTTDPHFSRIPKLKLYGSP